MNGMTLFTGFDGAGIGMAQAGINIVGGIEYDDAIAEVARANGHPVTTADILQVDPYQYAHANIQALHASPPCPNFSLAKTGRGETAHDIALAQAVCDWITVIRPEIFTLENVYAYRNSQSWRMIENTLFRLGYLPDVQHVNAADMGVPQSRKRMIVRALRGRMVPQFPAPVPWVGWYEAIEDLIPTLPESNFAPWQLARLPKELQSFVIGNGERSNPIPTDNPMDTITSNRNQRSLHAFLVGGANTSAVQAREGVGVSAADEPSRLINASNSLSYRAFLVNGALSTSGETKSLQIHDQDEPTGTIVSTMNSVKDTRAWLSHGRVVKMTTRALARFQSFPDDYVLPDNNALACKGIGNAVPPLMMRRIWEGLL